MYCVYSIRDLNAEGRVVYIGKTGNLKSRWAGHLKSAENPKLPIHKYMASVGTQYFECEELATFDNNYDALVEEARLIAIHREYGYILNISNGTKINTRRGQSVSKRWRDKFVY